MDIVSTFHNYFNKDRAIGHDFNLFKYSDLLFLGEDKEGNVSIVCISNKPNRSQLRQRTKQISIECNMKVQYLVNGEIDKNTVHIVRCFTSIEREKDIFIELTPLFDEASRQEDQEAALLEIVSTLTSFFANKSEPSDSELQGLYAELTTIQQYQQSLNLSDYWQSRDRMKFDFSISDEIKIEVKSTIKNERKHHFKHEQLAYETYDIYVISYMLRHDDAGESLFDLIEVTKPMIKSDPRKLLILERYLKNTSELRLQQFRFNRQITNSKRNIYRAEDIPRFIETAPTGITNAEYDCNLTGIIPLEETAFINQIQRVQNQKKDEVRTDE